MSLSLCSLFPPSSGIGCYQDGHSAPACLVLLGSSTQASQSTVLLFPRTSKGVQTSHCPRPGVPPPLWPVSSTLPSPLNSISPCNSWQLCPLACSFFPARIIPRRLSRVPQRDPVLAKSRAQACSSLLPLLALVPNKREGRSSTWAPVLEESGLPGFQKSCLADRRAAEEARDPPEKAPGAMGEDRGGFTVRPMKSHGKCGVWGSWNQIYNCIILFPEKFYRIACRPREDI